MCAKLSRLKILPHLTKREPDVCYVAPQQTSGENMSKANGNIEIQQIASVSFFSLCNLPAFNPRPAVDCNNGQNHIPAFGESALEAINVM